MVFQQDDMDLDSPVWSMPSSPFYTTNEGWGQCASLCLGKVRDNRFADSLNGVFNSIAFNWIARGNGQSTCQCLSTKTDCARNNELGADYEYDDQSVYGVGDINLYDKEFCSGGTCNNLQVCREVNNAGEESFYLPLDASFNDSTERFINLCFFFTIV